MSVKSEQLALPMYEYAQLNDAINKRGNSYHVIGRGDVMRLPTSLNYFRSRVEDGTLDAGKLPDSCRQRRAAYGVNWMTSYPPEVATEHVGWYSAQPSAAWASEVVLQSNGSWLCDKRKYAAPNNDGSVLMSPVKTTSPASDQIFKSDCSYGERPLPVPVPTGDANDVDNMEDFAYQFKQHRIKLGYTQADVGMALGTIYGSVFSQTTICRFEALQLSAKNMRKLRPLLARWLNGSDGGTDGSPEDDGDDPTTKFSQCRQRKKRTNIDAALRETLEATFRRQQKPNADEIARLSNALRLDREVVRVWFCNRRQKHKKRGQPVALQTERVVCDHTVSSCTAESAPLTFNPTESVFRNRPNMPAVTCYPQLPTDQQHPAAPSMTSYQHRKQPYDDQQQQQHLVSDVRATERRPVTSRDFSHCHQQQATYFSSQYHHHQQQQHLHHNYHHPQQQRVQYDVYSSDNWRRESASAALGLGQSPSSTINPQSVA